MLDLRLEQRRACARTSPARLGGRGARAERMFHADSQVDKDALAAARALVTAWARASSSARAPTTRVGERIAALLLTTGAINDAFDKTLRPSAARVVVRPPNCVAQLAAHQACGAASVGVRVGTTCRLGRWRHRGAAPPAGKAAASRRASRPRTRACASVCARAHARAWTRPCGRAHVGARTYTGGRLRGHTRACSCVCVRSGRDACTCAVARTCSRARAVVTLTCTCRCACRACRACRACTRCRAGAVRVLLLRCDRAARAVMRRRRAWRVPHLPPHDRCQVHGWRAALPAAGSRRVQRHTGTSLGGSCGGGDCGPPRPAALRARRELRR